MMHHLQTRAGDTYGYDPSSNAVFYLEAGAEDFTYDDGVTYLAACGCRAATGCQCGRKIKPTTTATPLSEVRAGVERVRREMRAEKAEREAERARRRVRNEIAAAYRAVSSRPVPDGYAEGLKTLGLPRPLPIVRDDDGIPLPYETALQRR